MHPLSQRVLLYNRRLELLKAGDRVGVAVSGGIDSVALLRLLLELRGELGIVLSVVHFNHKLRGGESDADEKFVAGLARGYGLEFHCDSDDVAGHAREGGFSVEAAARELRYGFFRWLLVEGPSGAEAPDQGRVSDRSAGSAAPPQTPPPPVDPQGLKPESEEAHLRGPEGPLFHGDGQSGELSARGTAEAVPFLVSDSRAGGAAESRALSKLDKIATGHTLDDQAETVLMRMIRGAGMRGLGGIYPRVPIQNNDGEIYGEIVRPLLGIRRRELEQYLRDIGQVWREDSSNADITLTRNRVRKLLMPLLEREFNPAVAENLAELAEIARGEEDYWENEIAEWMGTRAASLKRTRLLSGPLAVQRRLVKAIGEQARIPLEFKHVEDILRFAAENTGSDKELSLPLGWKLRRNADELFFLARGQCEPKPPRDYEYEVPIPGEIVVSEIGTQIETQQIPAEAVAEYNSDQLLDAASLPKHLRLRNWRPGDRFWPAHTKSPRKIKELLQERRVAQPERKGWPVIASRDEIVWVRGFLPPAKLRARAGREAIRIVERSLAGKASGVELSGGRGGDKLP